MTPGEFDWGLAPLRHHDDTYDVDFRAVKRGVVYVSDHPDRPVAAEYDGDISGALYWPPAVQSTIGGVAARPTGSWGFGFPARVVARDEQAGGAPVVSRRTGSRADLARANGLPDLAIRPLAGAGHVDESYEAQSVPGRAQPVGANPDPYTVRGVVGRGLEKPGSLPPVAAGDLGSQPKLPGLPSASAGTTTGAKRTIPRGAPGSGWGGSWVPPQGWPTIVLAGTEAYGMHEVIMPAANGVVLASQDTHIGGRDGSRISETASPAWGADRAGRAVPTGTLATLMTPLGAGVALDMRRKLDREGRVESTAEVVGHFEGFGEGDGYGAASLSSSLSVGRRGLNEDHGGDLHLLTGAPWILAGTRSGPYDGPLAFERALSPGGREGTVPHLVHLQFAEGRNEWQWHVAVPNYTDPPPRKPPGDPDGGEGTDGGPGLPPIGPLVPGGGRGVTEEERRRGGDVPGDGNGPADKPKKKRKPDDEDPFEPLFPPPDEDRLPDDPFRRPGFPGFPLPPRPATVGPADRIVGQRTAGSPHEWHAAGLALRARPLTWDPAATSAVPGDGTTPDELVEEFRRAPVTGAIWGWAKESGGAWVSDELEADRFRDATVGDGGGLVFGPPELRPRDVACGGEGIPDGQRVRARTFVAVTDNAYWAAGTPCGSTGGIKSGFRWSGKASGDLGWDSVDSSGAATEVLRFADDAISITSGKALRLSATGNEDNDTDSVELLWDGPTTFKWYADSVGFALIHELQNLSADRTVTHQNRSGTIAHRDHVASAVDLDAPTSSNSHTGDTSETTLHTTSVAAARLVAGTEISFRGVLRRTGTAGDITVKVKLDGVTLHQAAIASGGPLGATFEGWAQIETAGASGTFSGPLVYVTEDGTVNGDIQLAQTIDTTGSVDLVVTGQLANGADTVELSSIVVRITSGAE